MTVLLLRGYNNYFNRIVKQENSISDYKTASTSYLEYGSVNFDYQDGILTSLVVGSSQQLEQSDYILDFESGDTPDYLIVHDNTNIKSRWFVVECVKIRGGQYKLALKRDVLVDFNDKIMNSPCFVEKGFINDRNSPLLLNPEGMQFIQQKQEEKLLRDKTNCAWLVGYLKKDMQAKTVTHVWPASTGAIPANSLPFADCINYIGTTNSSATKTAIKILPGSSSVKFRVRYRARNGWDYDLRESFSLDQTLLSNYTGGISTDWEELNSVALYMDHHGSGPGYTNYAVMQRIGRELLDHTFNWGYVKDSFDNMMSNAKYDAITSANRVEVEDNFVATYNGMLVSHNNKNYKLNVSAARENTATKFFTGEDNTANTYLSNLYYSPDMGSGAGGTWYVQRNQDNPTRNKIRVTYKFQEFVINAVEVEEGTITLNLPASGIRNECPDAAYDMFCMPIDPSALSFNVAKSNAYIGPTSTGMSVARTTENNFAIAMELATLTGAGTSAGEIYDLQLLPYCPLDKNFVESTRVIQSAWADNPSDVRMYLTGLTEGVDYTYITKTSNDTTTNVGIIFFPKSANFDANINYTVDSTHIEDEEKKIDYPVLKYMSHSDDTGYAGDWPLYFIEFPYASLHEFGADDISWSEGIQSWIDQNKGQLLGWYGGNKNIVGLYFIVFEKGQYNSSTTYTDISWATEEWFAVNTDWIVPEDELSKKIDNETDFYRLTSPNYNSFYEFKKSKLQNNTINGLRAICTYKPFSPYIKINPQLDGSFYSLADYNDNIGLMLAGDFSLPMISDAMINYELQNRNYQAIFNREVANLDVNQRIAREQQEFTGIVGAITGGVGGAGAGALAGAKAGPYGAIAGAVIGGVGGTALGVGGYLKDKEWLQEQQAEARDFAVDKFNYQLGNIQALPQTMTKSTPLSYNNKVWPILEKFSCTDTEKDLLKKKIRYDGMTVMAIGTLQEYATAGGYLKGKMIRFENLNDDSHIANAIYEEVNKGFYEGE